MKTSSHTTLSAKPEGARKRLDSATAREMVKIREARKAYRQYFDRCFWSFDPDYRVTAKDILWVAHELMNNGGRDAWVAGARLCR